MKLGPLQLLAIGFENPEFRGDILDELDAVRGRGVIRLIDLLFVYCDSTGDIAIMTDTDLDTEDQVSYGSALSSLAGLDESSTADVEVSTASSAYGIDPEAVRSIITGLAPGQAVALVLFEHNWAGGLAEAVRNAGGFLMAQGILTRDAVLMVGSELAAIASAEQVIAATEALKGAAMLDALAFTDAAEEAQALMTDSVVTSSIAAETLRTLMGVGVVDDSEIETAILSLVEAGLVAPDLVAVAMDRADGAIAAVEDALAAQADAISYS